MNIRDIINIIDGELHSGNYEDEIGIIEQNSSLIGRGDTFIAFVGQNADGHNYIQDAIKNGAKTCIVSREGITSDEANIIYVEDTEKALKQIIEYKISEIDPLVISVTGSVGKTSTKELIAEVLNTKFKTFKSQGNLNSERGLPLSCSSMEKETEVAVLEMGMDALGQISNMSKMAKPDIAVITNIGSSHIGEVGGKENILEAKLEILHGLKEGGVLFLSNDNRYLREYAEFAKKENNKFNITTYGIEHPADVIAKNIQRFDNYTEFEVEILDKIEKYHINAVGTHNVYNALIAIAIAKSLNLDQEQIQEGLKKIKVTERRMDKFVTTSNMIVYDDSYNASYESVRAAIDVINNRQYYGRKIAILGDILELGGYSEKYHRKIGKILIENNFDILISAGENTKYINDEIEKQKTLDENIKIETFHFENADEIIENMNNIFIQDDIVLIKASNSMNFNKIAEVLKKDEVELKDLK